jgi:hypothetical protein
MGEVRNAYKNLVGKPEGKTHPRRVDVDGRIISVASFSLSSFRLMFISNYMGKFYKM